MSAKRYQVFISSTYKDLIEERRAVEQTIIRAGDFPVGMEAFPAADEEQFEFIKTLIAQCDYYVLIIAGKYGSLADDGLSYTEKEHDYAKEIGVPVLVLLRDGLDELPAKDTEADPARREKLAAFIDKACGKRVRSTWKNPDALKLAVREALDHAKATKKRPGWVRGDKPVADETLEQLVTLQTENRQLAAENMKLKEELKPEVGVPTNIAGLDQTITVTCSYLVSESFGQKSQKVSINTDFGEVFSFIAPNILARKTDGEVKRALAHMLCTQNATTPNRTSFHDLDEHDFQTFRVQFMALGLVDIAPDAKNDLTWTLTGEGRREMMSSRTVTTE